MDHPLGDIGPKKRYDVEANTKWLTELVRILGDWFGFGKTVSVYVSCARTRHDAQSNLIFLYIT